MELESLRELRELGEQGMRPDPKSWLTFHDKVAEVAGRAIADIEQIRADVRKLALSALDLIAVVSGSGETMLAQPPYCDMYADIKAASEC